MSTTLLFLAATHGTGALISSYIAASAILRRPSLFSTNLAIFGFALSWWTIFQGFEIITPTAEGSFLWTSIAYPGIQVSVLSLLSICYGLSSGTNRIPAWIWAILCIIPAITTGITLTNPWHTLMWRNMHITANGLAGFSPGPWYPVHIGYMYLLLAFCTSFLLYGVFRRSGEVRAQSVIILLFGSIPVITNILYLIRVDTTSGIDYTPLGLIITAVGIHIAFNAYGTSGVVPVARSWLVENLRDPIATCLPSGVIIDSNRNFSTMFGSVIGSPAHIQAVLPNWEELISSMKDDHISHTFEFDDSEHLRWLEAGIAYMRRIKHSVYAVIFRDITGHIRDQQQLELAVEETRNRLSEVNLLQTQLREQTIRDELTDLYNRRFWSGAIEREFALAQRSSYPLSIAMLDIDHFKSVNDTYGHRVGDGILLLLADLLRTTLRRSDLIFRFGGEEFVLVMPGVHAAEAKKRLDTLRRTVEASPYHHEPFGEIRITVSIGIADIPSGGAEPNEILERADSAMYQAKEAGRNRVCTYE